MSSLPITSVIAACLALMMFPLTLNVSMRRVAVGKAMGDVAGAAFGDGGDLRLKRAIRAFGNFVEYVPTCLVMLALAETAGASETMLWTVGLVFVAGRITHALGMLFSASPALRVIGMFATYAGLLVPGAWLLMRLW